jgi:hypothetical protein
VLFSRSDAESNDQTDTCDNGGWAYWVDREGFRKVHLPDDEDE